MHGGAFVSEDEDRGVAAAEGASREEARPGALRWIGAALLIGVLAGVGAVVLSVLAGWSETLHGDASWTLWLLPLFSILGIFVYQKLSIPLSTGTLSVVDAQRVGKPVPVKLALAIPLGTALTLLGGGSVGKEAAALQMGGAIASGTASWLSRGETGDKRGIYRTVILCGMAAAFSALMFAPVAAALFVLELTRMKPSHLRDARLLCVPLSSAVAYAIARVCGVGNLWVVAVDVPSFSSCLLEVIVLGALCAFAGVAFVLLLKMARTVAVTFLRTPYVRVVVGSLLVVAIVFFSGQDLVSGTGGALIEMAISGVDVGSWTFLWKMLLTVACLGFGLKGGEIMPIFSIGACIGCVLGAVMGVSPAFMAAVGLVAMFGACTRCPVAAVAIGIEAFGWAGAPFFIIVALIGLISSYAMNIYDGTTWVLDLPWARGDSEDRFANADTAGNHQGAARR